MLEPDIYERRFREKANSLGHDKTASTPTSEIESYRLNGVTPALAVSRHFGKMKLKTAESEVRFQKVLDAVCHASGHTLDDIKGTDTQTWRDIKSISCIIAVNDKNIRPHSVMRDALGLKYNSMVNHYVDRASNRDDSIVFQTILEDSRKELTDV